MKSSTVCVYIDQLHLEHIYIFFIAEHMCQNDALKKQQQRAKIVLKFFPPPAVTQSCYTVDLRAQRTNFRAANRAVFIYAS